jgi:lipopolysaccharide export system permease protein
MILDRYIARRFLATFGATLLAFLCILVLIDFVEQIRRFGDDVDGLRPLLALTLLGAPRGLYEILPLVTIIAALVLFLALGRSCELVVTRAAGRSALRMLLAPMAVALLLGALAVAAVNPIVAATTRELESRIDRINGETSILVLAEDGLWLRQAGETGQTVIRAGRSNLDGTELGEVTFLSFGQDGQPERRIEAQAARLEAGRWRLTEAKAWPLGAPNPEAEATLYAHLDLPSTLTPDQIRDSFGTPSSISIWELPAFIERLREAGFATQRHQTFLHAELAQPVFLLAMVLIAAGFTLGHPRGRRLGLFVLAAVLTGFAAHFLGNFAQVLGENGQVPPALAGWAPPAATVAAALGLLLHLEEG